MLSSAPRLPAKAGLIGLMVLGALMLWLGNPVIWLWVGSQMTESQQGEFGPYVVVALGILASTVAVSLALGRLSRAYDRVSGSDRSVRVRLPWLRSMRDERAPDREITVLDLILICTAIAAIISFVVWFVLFAGSPV
jgi:hypothetical protein